MKFTLSEVLPEYNKKIGGAAKASAQRDIAAEQEKTLRWKLIAGFIGFILLASIARKVLK